MVFKFNGVQRHRAFQGRRLGHTTWEDTTGTHVRRRVGDAKFAKVQKGETVVNKEGTWEYRRKVGV